MIEQVKTLGKPVTFIGDGVPVFKDRLIETLGSVDNDGLAAFGNDAVRYQRASSIAILGKLYLADGREVAAHEFVPRYLRATQAERELKNK